MCFAQRGQGLVRPHGHNGLRSVLRHGQEDALHILLGVMEGFAQLDPLGFIRDFFRMLRSGQIMQMNQMPHPIGIGLGLGISGFQCFAFQQLPCA